MLPIHAARIEDLGRSDLVKVDCAACQHVRAADAGGAAGERPPWSYINPGLVAAAGRRSRRGAGRAEVSGSVSADPGKAAAL
jgi:hypothetical protein